MASQRVFCVKNGFRGVRAPVAPRTAPRWRPDGAPTAPRRRRAGNAFVVPAPARHHGAVLQARGLSVEVGGRLTLVEASFTVRAGDKVGLVGRNGAGKTSLLRVLGGEDAAAGGTVLRRGSLGYLPQDPRPEGAGVDATALSHVLSGRGLDEAARRLEKLRLAVEEHPSERNVSRYARAEDAYRDDGGYAA